MTRIYSDLCAICEQPRSEGHQKACPEGDQSGIKRPGNLYEGLYVDEDADSNITGPDEDSEECAACTAEPVRACPGPQSNVELADDDLGNSLEYLSILQDICSVFTEIEGMWRQAGREEIHAVSVAFATHVGYATLLKLEERLRDLDERVSIAKLQDKCCLPIKGDSNADEVSCWHILLNDLAAAEKALQHHHEGHNAGMSKKMLLQKPMDYFKATDDSSMSSLATAALVENIMQLIESSRAPSAIVRNSTPVYADLGYSLSKHSGDNINLRLILGMNVLKQSYETHVLSMQQPSLTPRYRLAALKLAQAAATSVRTIIDDKDCFPCRCTQTLAFHLQHLEEDLSHFAGQKCWNLYFQSPYVSGSHILEVLDLCHYYGSKLFLYRHYIGALVHAYNVLRQLAALEEMPLLEYLCEEFKSQWFPGGVRPTKNFRACWTRYIGARLKFKKGHRRDRQDSWCMAVPAHAARKAAGLGVGRGELKNEKDVPMLFAIKQQDYDVADLQWEKLRTQAGSHRLIRDASRLQDLLPRLEQDLNSRKSDAAGPSKVRLNHFDVFRDCVRIVQQVSDATHTDTKEKGMNCICFVTAVLEGGDRIVDTRASGKIDGKGSCWTKAEREGVLKTTTESMKTVLAGRPASEWSWMF